MALGQIEAAASPVAATGWMDRIVCDDARSALLDVPENAVDLSFWSPPYYVGKSYEQEMTFPEWQELLRTVVEAHSRIIKPGGFMVVNIADILCYSDPDLPRYQADNVRGKGNPVTRQDVLEAMRRHPDANRRELGELLGCSEQTVQRRLEHNNVRGGKQKDATRVLLTGEMVVQRSAEAGFFLYDQRVWHKDPCWANSQWHSTSYRAVDEFEHVYVFCKPGIVAYDRERLSAEEWSEWGSRGVWSIRSVSRNERHEAEFPEELAERVVRLFSPEHGVVLDPFVGSGTTAVVAKRLNRHWLGIEKDAQYAETARQRVEDA